MLINLDQYTNLYAKRTLQLKTENVNKTLEQLKHTLPTAISYCLIETSEKRVANESLLTHGLNEETIDGRQRHTYVSYTRSCFLHSCIILLRL